MDGLMLDTEALAKKAWQEAGRVTGFPIDDELFRSMIGRGKRDCAAHLRHVLGPEFDFETLYRLCAEYDEAHIARHGVPLKPGIGELLEELSARRLPLAVATSTRQAKARQRLEQAGLLRYFQALVGGDEIAAGKPAPDIYLEAVRRLAVDPARTFALEDSFAGVRAAHAAGLNVIMVPDLLAPTDEIAALAYRVVPSLREAGPILLASADYSSSSPA
jgi:HAD superfamily hydrolase (TIGR01509 family)